MQQDTDKDGFVRSNGVIGLTGRGFDIVCKCGMVGRQQGCLFWDNSWVDVEGTMGLWFRYRIDERNKSWWICMRRCKRTCWQVCTSGDSFRNSYILVQCAISTYGVKLMYIRLQTDIFLLYSHGALVMIDARKLQCVHLYLSIYCMFHTLYFYCFLVAKLSWRRLQLFLFFRGR